MPTKAILVIAILLLCLFPAEAKHRHTALRQEIALRMTNDGKYRPVTHNRAARGARRPNRTRSARIARRSRITHVRGSDGLLAYLPHPAGCPRTDFCGCGVSIRVFGRPIRSLFLAANWLRFPRAFPGSGMVAARRGHVMYIVRYDGNGVALVYDPNSGQHRTRLHLRSLAGYTVVNPRG